MKKQVIDQSAHFLLACVVLTPVALWPGIGTFAYAGFCLGMVREATETDPILSGGSLLDILVWTLGGAAVGVLAGLTAL